MSGERPSEEEIKSWKVLDLKEKCKILGIATTGNKAQLQKKLLAHFSYTKEETAVPEKKKAQKRTKPDLNVQLKGLSQKSWDDTKKKKKSGTEHYQNMHKKKKSETKSEKLNPLGMKYKIMAIKDNPSETEESCKPIHLPNTGPIDENLCPIFDPTLCTQQESSEDEGESLKDEDEMINAQRHVFGW
ncbi:hypothetical protein RFI_30336 [Reticulomyxa filosa]|uniref:SAP domain-containing protein n=1 Tax=Reticulomyxa filosa TaxID=46433 RepID=X6M0X0_RETFI|nr:hypothetical protein RFI_30336 [Reticulomyxa filosa]|eukprot:ETO07057.1 hypothetical protein RFI_30336 [Reticulomyxa filosa]